MAKFKFSDIAYNITDKKMPVSGDEILYIGLEHLDSGNLHVTRWGSKVPLIGEKLVMKKGDILFGRRNTYLRRASIAPHDGLFSAHGMIFRPKTNVVDKEYFPFFIASDYFIDEAIKISVGSLSPTVNWGTLKNLEFELPSLEKQRKLAKILWAAEETKQAYKKLLQKTDDMVKAKFEEMFKEYPRERFGNLCSTHARIGWQRLTKEEFLDEGDYYLVTGWDIMPDHTVSFEKCKYVTKDRYEQDQKLILKKNDVLLTKDGTLGKVAIIKEMDKPATLNGHIFVIRPKDDRIIPDLLIGIFTSNDFISQMENNKTGSTIVGITQKAILEFQIPFAPVEVQQRFVDFMYQIDKSKQQLQKSLDSLNAMMRALVNQSFN